MCAVHLKEFVGKVVLVTGAGSGIGAKAAIDYTRAGADVAIASRSTKKLENVGELCGKAGKEPMMLHVDVANHDENVCLIEKTIERYKKLDVLVNNAGIFFFDGIEKVTMENFDKLSNINVKGVMDLTLLSVPHLTKTKGNIVNISSVCGLRAFPSLLTYCMSKAAVNQITRCSALDLAPKGIRVNSVNPGVTDTQLFETGGLSSAQVQDFYKKESTTHPLGRIGRVEDISNAILFVSSSKQGSWITGLHITVDGGWHNVCPW